MVNLTKRSTCVQEERNNMIFLDLEYQCRYTIYISELIKVFAEVITKLSTTRARGTPNGLYCPPGYSRTPIDSDRSPRNEVSAKSVKSIFTKST